MPRGDGTGPLRGRGGGRRDRRGPLGAGPEGNCVCPKCGTKTPHTIGKPCTSILCPKCNTSMIREQ